MYGSGAYLCSYMLQSLKETYSSELVNLAIDPIEC